MYCDYSDGILRLRAGGGRAISPMIWFLPKNAHIKVGDTVVSYNLTSVAEAWTIAGENRTNIIVAANSRS